MKQWKHSVFLLQALEQPQLLASIDDKSKFTFQLVLHHQISAGHIIAALAPDTLAQRIHATCETNKTINYSQPETISANQTPSSAQSRLIHKL